MCCHRPGRHWAVRRRRSSRSRERLGAGIAAHGGSTDGQLRALPTLETAAGISSRGAALGAGLRKLPAKLTGSGIGTSGFATDGRTTKTRIVDELAGAGIGSRGAGLDAGPIGIPPGGETIEARTVAGSAALGAGLRKLPGKTSLAVAASGGAALDGSLQEIPTKVAGVGTASSTAALGGALGVLDPKITQAGSASRGSAVDAAPEVDAADTKAIGADLRSAGASVGGAPNILRSLFRPAAVGFAAAGSALGGLLRKLPLKLTDGGAASSGSAVSGGLSALPTTKSQAGLASAGAATSAGAEKIPVPPEWEFVVTNVSAGPNSFSTIGSTGTADDQLIPSGFLTPDSPAGAVINFLRIRGNQFQLRFRLDDTRFAEFVENDYFLEIADEDDSIIALLWMYGSTWGTDRYRINSDSFFFRRFPGCDQYVCTHRRRRNRGAGPHL